MARFLTYVDAASGRLYPLVATLIELAQRVWGALTRFGVWDARIGPRVVDPSR
jgi:hypothetical protein